jgi:deoxyribodipyrimidine photolyase-like uncharacterized protein
MIQKNQRMSMMYSVLDKMDKATREEVFDQAAHYLDTVEEL